MYDQFTATEIAKSEREIKQLEKENAELRDYLNQVKAWVDEGKPLMDSMNATALFSMGAWWADRPWRKK